MLEQIKNKKELFNDMMSNKISFQHYINIYHELLDNKMFYKKIYIILENNNIFLKKQKTQFFKTLYEKNKKLSFLLSLFITALEEEHLIDIFGEGYKTTRLGEGFKRGYSGRCFFFKLNGHISMYFIDHRGSGLNIPKDISDEDFLQYMVDLFELIVTKTDLIDVYKKNFSEYFL